LVFDFKDPSTIEMTPELLGVDLVDRVRKEPDLVLEDTSLARGREVAVHGDTSRFEVTHHLVRCPFFILLHFRFSRKTLECGA
jgi:hypothetical protein